MNHTKWLRLLVAAMLVIAVFGHLPYGYYNLLRFVVTASAVYLAAIAAKQNQQGWAVVLGLIALLFNPVIPLHMSREIWAIVDLIIAATVMLSWKRV